MAAHQIEVNVFSMKSLEAFKKSLIDYKKSLPDRIQAFLDALLEEGIRVARAEVADTSKPYGTHQMQDFITFSKKVDYDSTGCYGILRAEGQTLQSKWYRSGAKGDEAEEVNGSINALLAVEFGTAAFAIPAPNGKGGQGTNSKGGNAGKADWYFARGVDDDGNPTDWQHATAIKPTRPLHKAMLTMQEEIDTIARRYF